MYCIGMTLYSGFLFKHLVVGFFCGWLLIEAPLKARKLAGAAVAG